MSEHDSTSMVDRAIAVATAAHAGQMRKGSAIPYIVHPMETAAICARLTTDPATIAAALLHDVIEDTPLTYEDVLEQCGERVAAIVVAETEDKMRNYRACDSWHNRKLATIEHLQHCDDEAVLIVCLADKLSNMRAMQQDVKNLGDKLWDRFNMSDPAEHAWYYRSVCDALKPHLEDTCAWQELNALIREVFCV